MKEQRAASVVDFERLADTLMDLAITEYLSCAELTPKLVVMGLAPGGTDYQFSSVPIVEFMTQASGEAGQVVVAALLERLSKDPEVLLVGYVSEAWLNRYTKEAREQRGPMVNPEDEPNREEALMMILRSANCEALKTCPLVREGSKTTVGKGDLLFNPRTLDTRQSRYTH